MPNPMNSYYASALHLEFPENKAGRRANATLGSGGVLLLAVDVMLFHEPN